MHLGLLIIALLLCANSAWAGACACVLSKDFKLSAVGVETTRPQFEPEPSAFADGKSSVRGLSLGITKAQAESVLHRLGLSLLFFQSSDLAMNICRGRTLVGTVRFDQSGRVNKLELSPYYFAVGRVVLREFAEEVFKRYAVQPAKIGDDNCFQDLTCFRGTSRANEQFLILRIGEDVQLHIRK